MADPDDEAKTIDLIKAMEKMLKVIRAVFTHLMQRDKGTNNLVTVMTEIKKIYAEVQDLIQFDWALLISQKGNGPMQQGLKLLGRINTEVWVNAYRIMPQLPYELIQDLPQLDEMFPDLKSMGEAVVAAHSKSDSGHPGHLKTVEHSHATRTSPFQWPQSFDDLLSLAGPIVRNFLEFKHLTTGIIRACTTRSLRPSFCLSSAQFQTSSPRVSQSRSSNSHIILITNLLSLSSWRTIV
jgi:hypothetical protein